MKKKYTLFDYVLGILAYALIAIAFLAIWSDSKMFSKLLLTDLLAIFIVMVIQKYKKQNP